MERDYTGPARVSGSAGTGKTIVALHRAVHLARTHPEARVLLTTFSDTLANALHTKLKRLVGSEPRLAERIDVHSLNAIGLRLYKSHCGPVTLASREVVRELLNEAAKAVGGHKFSLHFLLTEWEQVVDAWQLETWEAYRDVARLGRKTRLPEAQRAVLWSIFERVRGGLKAQKLTTHAGMFTALASALAGSKNPPFDFAVVDEAQDISVSHICASWPRSVAIGPMLSSSPATSASASSSSRSRGSPSAWTFAGAPARLRINYRTSHQIRQQADRLLGPAVTDVDGNSEDRSDTVSVFNGPPPIIRVLKSEAEEIKAVGTWLAEQSKAGVLPHEFGVFVRSDGATGPRPRPRSRSAGLPFKILDEHVETTSGHVSISTMHLAKGLEFRAVVVMACDDEIIPLAGAHRDGWRRRRTCRRSTTPSATCSTSPARVHGIICWSRASSRHRSFLTICGPRAEVNDEHCHPVTVTTSAINRAASSCVALLRGMFRHHVFARPVA